MIDNIIISNNLKFVYSKVVITNIDILYNMNT